MDEISVIRRLMDEKDWKALKAELNNYEPFQIADIIELLSEPEQAIFFRILPGEMAKDIFKHLSLNEQERMIENIANNYLQVSELLNDLDPDVRTAFFEELPGKVSQRLMQMLSVEERKIAIRLLGYPKESIGRLMTPEYIAVKPHFTVQEALTHIRKFGRNSETLNVIYVVDTSWKLIDDIRIREIILASPEQTIAEITDNRFVSLNAYDDREVAVKIFQDHDRVALPVTDSEGTLLGIITVDDVMDVIEEETTEDIEKMGALAASHEPYLKTGIINLSKNRIIWLMVLMISATLTSSIISGFEEGLMALPILMAFIPMLMDTGGNAGAQSATLIIRGMAVGEIALTDIVRVVWKEIRVAALCGLCLGLINFIRIYFMHGKNLKLSVSVSLALFCTIMMAKLVGGMLPIIAKRMKVDPAIMAAPVITTIVDALSLVIYFAIAKVLMGI
jgi:magnesium transporter